jgi:DNA topoisomerase-1
MSLDTVTLEDALRLLSLPRVVGIDTEGIEVTAQKGRYGPYLKKGTDSRTLETEEQIFAITIDEALAIYALPKVRGRAAAAPPLRELGPDPVSGEPILLKDGRFGPYVTDGTVNASLRKGDDPNSITPERAAELIADRRLAAPTKKTRKATKKAPSKKVVAKKAAAKKSGATTTVKKAAAKKATKKAAAKKTGVGRASAEKAGVGV